MNIIPLNHTESVEISCGDVTHVQQIADYLEVIIKSEENDPEYRCVWLKSEKSYNKVSFIDHIKFQFSGNLEVVCDDWMEDENIPKSSLDESWMRWNEILDVMEFNHVRSIGDTIYDLPLDYVHHIDLSYASIEELFFDKKYGEGKFHVVLNASFNDLNGKTGGYYTGPFHFYCDQVNLIIE